MYFSMSQHILFSTAKHKDLKKSLILSPAKIIVTALKAMKFCLKKVSSLLPIFLMLSGVLASGFQGFLQTMVRNNSTETKSKDSHKLCWPQKTKCEVSQNHDKAWQLFSSVFFFWFLYTSAANTFVLETHLFCVCVHPSLPDGFEHYTLEARLTLSKEICYFFQENKVTYQCVRQGQKRYKAFMMK